MCMLAARLRMRCTAQIGYGRHCIGRRGDDKQASQQETYETKRSQPHTDFDQGYGIVMGDSRSLVKYKGWSELVIM